jgi:hypothetical protein
MAMQAGLIAFVAQVDLKRLQSLTMQRREVSLDEKRQDRSHSVLDSLMTTRSKGGLLSEENVLP